MDVFDRKLDSAITPTLLEAGFTEARPYFFERRGDLGRDFVYLDVEASSFVVHLSFKPSYMEEIDELHAHLLSPDEPNIGGSSYLSPGGMTHRPVEYPCKTAASRDRSLAMAAAGLRSHALSWLASLRDPGHYADAVPPTANMYVGRANEVAGRLQAARAAYEDQWQRLLACWQMVPFSNFASFEGSREFIYLCLKLDRESEKRERLMDVTAFRPQVVPLRD